MKRRDFLKGILPAAATPWLLNGIPIQAMAHGLSAQDFTCEEVGDRALVIVQLHGGNDGANMLVPIEQYDDYRNLRPNIGIRKTGSRKYIPLDSQLPLAAQAGFHPEMTRLKNIYDNGMLHIVNGVSYSNTNKSHFKSSNIWLAGADAGTGVGEKSGWVGRFLDHRFPGYPNAYPTAELPDPLALEFESRAISLAFHREMGMPMGLTLSNEPTNFSQSLNGVTGVAPTNFPSNRHGSQMQYLVDMMASSNVYGARLKQLYLAGTNTVTYPETYHSYTTRHKDNRLAAQLKTVARLLSGGCKSKIYLVRLHGFDTHIQQTASNDPSYGQHAVLLYHVSEALAAFQEDLVNQGLHQKVATVTFSEFGRQVGENANRGTDHGTLAPMMIMGGGIKPGVSGVNPDYTNLNGNSFAGLQYDYRQIFTTLLQDWLGAGPNSLAYTQFGGFESAKLDIVNDTFQPGPNELPINFVADPFCFESTFPITLNYFQATLLPHLSVQLDWETETELNNDHFIVERSADGALFEPILRVAGSGNASSATRYQTLDQQPFSGRSWYRLKQVDYDGTYTYYQKVEVYLKPGVEARVQLYNSPNPANEEVNLRILSSQNLPVRFRLFDTTGKLAIEKGWEILSGENTYYINVEGLKPGIYYGELVTNSGSAYSFRRLASVQQVIQR